MPGNDSHAGPNVRVSHEFRPKVEEDAIPNTNLPPLTACRNRLDGGAGRPAFRTVQRVLLSERAELLKWAMAAHHGESP